MKITEIEQQEFINIASQERLNSYKLSTHDKFLTILEQYIYNIKISESFYPILSIFEVALRNKIHDAIDSLIKPNWLLLELEAQCLLLFNEREILLQAAKKLQFMNKKLTKGALISELSFGFWVNLCKKSYKAIIWDKKNVFEFVFTNFPSTKEMNRIRFISPDLKTISQLRNRIFHHEIIINHPVGIKNCYSIIEKVLFYLSGKYSNLLVDTCRFKEVIKQKP